jgi:hypothetical protein
MALKTIRSIFLLSTVLLLPIVAPQFNSARGANFFAKPEFGGTCIRTDPCYFITAVNSASAGDKVYFKQDTYTGDNLPDRVLSVSKSIELLGGWNGSSSGILARNPDLYPSILDGGNARWVIYISGNISPTIDGFTVPEIMNRSKRIIYSPSEDGLSVVGLSSSGNNSICPDDKPLFLDF